MVAKYGLVLTMALLLSACYVSSNQAPFDSNQAPFDSNQVSAESHHRPDYIQALQWVVNADAEHDAATAIGRKDYRLFVLAGRGETMPGIKVSDKAALLQSCGKRYLTGSTDAIRSKKHQQLLVRAYEYAQQYNRLVAKACTYSQP